MKLYFEHKELYISDDNDYNFLIHYSLFLPVILGNTNLIPWYYNSFINYYLRIGNNALFFSLNEKEFDKFFYHSNIHHSFLQDNSLTKNNFINAINDNHYIIIQVDYYCIQYYSRYKKAHFVHPLLVYGYDSIKDEFNVLIFDETKGVFKERLSSDILIIALKSAKEYYQNGFPDIDNGLVGFYKFKNFAKYEFDIVFYIHELLNYINATGNLQELYFIFHHNVEIKQNSFGIGVYDKILDSLSKKNPKVYPDIDYRVIHMIWEHKKWMVKSIRYISQYYRIGQYLVDIVKHFEEIERKMTVIKNVYLKQANIESGFKSFYEIPKNPVVLDKLIMLLSELKGYELDAFKEFYNILFDLFMLDKSNILSPNIITWGEKTKCKNNIKIDYKDLVNIDMVRIYGGLSGKIIFSDKSCIDIISSHELFTDYQLDVKTVRWIEFEIDENHTCIPENCFFVFQASIAKCKNVSASSYLYVNDDAKALPEYAIDDNPYTYWKATDENQFDYLMIDFGEKTEFNSVMIQQYKRDIMPVKYVIQSSDDGISWVDLYFWEGELGCTPKLDIFESTSSRMVRVMFEGIHIEAFNAYAHPGIDCIKVFKRNQ